MGQLAWRNLWRHSRRTWLTMGAMIFCNALLVFMVSFQLGTYGLMIESKLRILTGDIQIQHKNYNAEPRMRYSVPDGEALAARLRNETRIEKIAARGIAFALASSEERSFGIQLMGVQPDREALVSTLPGLVKQGRYLQAGNVDEIVVGSVLARNLKIGVGDQLTFLGSARDGAFAAGVATVVGIIDSGSSDLDRSIAQIPLGYFDSSFNMQGHVHSIVVDAASLDDVPALQAQLQSLIGNPELVVLDWNTLEPGLRQAILSDMLGGVVVVSVLIILVAFSVLNTQLMSVLERTREFGVMMALGLRPAGLARLVVLETAVMSLLGLLLGCLLGTAITLYFQVHGIRIAGLADIAVKFNLPDALYPTLTVISVLVGPVTVFLGSMLAAIYPALRLFTLQPVAAMRAV